VRQIPGRLIGMTTDRRVVAPVMTSVPATGHPPREGRLVDHHEPDPARAGREHHLATMGPRGLADVAASARPGPRSLKGSPTPVPAASQPGVPQRIRDPCPAHGPSTGGCRPRRSGGLALADAEPDGSSLRDALLVCATEVTTSEEIARFAQAIAAVLAEMGGSAGDVASDAGAVVGGAR
jgi:glycine cleavage system pyridoxal-binding protein P